MWSMLTPPLVGVAQLGTGALHTLACHRDTAHVAAPGKEPHGPCKRPSPATDKQAHVKCMTPVACTCHDKQADDHHGCHAPPYDSWPRVDCWVAVWGTQGRVNWCMWANRAASQLCAVHSTTYHRVKATRAATEMPLLLLHCSTQPTVPVNAAALLHRSMFRCSHSDSNCTCGLIVLHKSLMLH